MLSRHQHPVDNLVELYHAIYVQNLQHAGHSPPRTTLSQ